MLRAHNKESKERNI